MAELADATDLKSVSHNNESMGSTPIRGIAYDSEPFDDLDRAIIYLSPIAFGSKDANLIEAVRLIGLYLSGERSERAEKKKQVPERFHQQNVLMSLLDDSTEYTFEQFRQLMLSAGYSRGTARNICNVKEVLKSLYKHGKITFEKEQGECRRWGKTETPCKIKRI